MRTSDTLTSSQKRAELQLEFFLKLQLKGIREVNGIASRPFPLLIAPSGAGKTFLVNRLADRHNLPLFSVNIPNWIPRGAKADTQITTVQLKDFVANNSAGIILLDEVNKLTVDHTHDNAWSSDLFAECLAVLDQDIRLESMGLEGLLPKFRRHFLIVGAAAFQDAWVRSHKDNASIGFGETKIIQSRELAFERLVRNQHAVPEELLYRFNDRLIVIAPPTVSEFAERIQGIRSSLSLQPLEKNALARMGNQATESGKMMRWLEGYLSECLAELPDASLKNLTAAVGDLAVSTVEVATYGSPATSAGNCKNRDLAFDRYEAALHELARSATHMCALCDSVVTGVSFSFYTTLQEKLYEGMKLGGHNLAASKSPEESIECYGKALRYIAYHAVRLALPSVTPKDRAEHAGKIQRFSYRLGRAFQMMTSKCDDYTEGKPFFDGVSEFIYCSENASARLDHLRTFEPPGADGTPS